MDKKLEQNLTKLFTEWCSESVKEISPLPLSGSDRRYFRIHGSHKTAMGVYNPDRSENIAFLTFSRHFKLKGLNVPQIYSEDLNNHIYLEQDLGDETLFSLLVKTREKENFSENLIKLYKEIISIMPRFQIVAGKDLDYSVCYPRGSFDRQSMMWDLNYFKYYFLKLAKISFDEQKLEDDFQKFCDFLLEAPQDFFLYRDFQSRNIMIFNEKPYFIDYQGGRKGALQYDIASLLFDAKADIPNQIREELLTHYMNEVGKFIKVDSKKFMQFYYGYVLIRITQALGAYGFRGFYERKEHFLKSVPYAIQNLEWLLQHADLPVQIPSLMKAWEKLVQSSYLRQFGDVNLRLTVRIQSFSYKRGIPWDERGHGGGYVFDCRSLPNPGRYKEYERLTGNDREVIEFFGKEKEMEEFLSHTISLVKHSIENYQKRNFTDLFVSFGCTGGQHRSVFCANKLAEHLKSKYDITIEIRHRELESLS
ncbi:MAG: phosphotransferase enzyme family protein [Ignavibacteria bacterium]|nr:phosphotransferase enzyme family protein [Ignavibacteria bacterium]